MKSVERAESVRLRLLGKSFNEIALTLHVSKSSLFTWLKDVRLTPEQEVALFKRGSRAGVMAIREARDRRWASYHAEATAEWPELSASPEFMFGLALYIGEGDKSGGIVGISNADPDVVVAAVKFVELLGVDRARIRGHVQIHDPARAAIVHKYWSDFLGLDPGQINRPTVAISCASKRRRGNTIPNGTFTVRVSDTRLAQKVKTWMRLAFTGTAVR